MSTLSQQTADSPKPPPPCMMVIFGASGDLTKRKLLPALYNLAREGLLSQQFAVVGFAFDQMNTDSFRELLTKEIKEFAAEPIDDKLWQWFLDRIYYVQGNFTDDSAYQRLKDQILAAEKKHGRPFARPGIYRMAKVTVVLLVSRSHRYHFDLSIVELGGFAEELL